MPQHFRDNAKGGVSSASVRGVSARKCNSAPEYHSLIGRFGFKRQKCQRPSSTGGPGFTVGLCKDRKQSSPPGVRVKCAEYLPSRHFPVLKSITVWSWLACCGRSRKRAEQAVCGRPGWTGCLGGRCCSLGWTLQFQIKFLQWLSVFGHQNVWCRTECCRVIPSFSLFFWFFDRKIKEEHALVTQVSVVGG